jgi:hypothetical protein
VPEAGRAGLRLSPPARALSGGGLAQAHVWRGSEQLAQQGLRRQPSTGGQVSVEQREDGEDALPAEGLSGPGTGRRVRHGLERKHSWLSASAVFACCTQPNAPGGRWRSSH